MIINLLPPPKDLDLVKLNKEIDAWELVHGERPDYLIMNIDTLKDMEKSVNLDLIKKAKPGAFYDAYREIPIAVSDYLDFGEVDLV